MIGNLRWRALALAWLVALGCAARPPTAAPGIELLDPNEGADAAQLEGAATTPDPELLASGASRPTASSQQDDSGFVPSRKPNAERAHAVASAPLHINESWWPFRARHLGITDAEARRRDAELSDSRAPAGFWDSQTSVEAVAVWTALCNECHGGRRSVQDALEMPAPARAWGAGEGLFFGQRRTYEQTFNVVRAGGPVKESGRPNMPAWRNILSTEMTWALLYFLEYQSGGIEGRFPPSLYPRRPSVLGKP